MEDMKVLTECLDSMKIPYTDLQLEQLYRYYELLIEKNKVMNLTAITNFNEVMIMRHNHAGLLARRNQGIKRFATVVLGLLTILTVFPVLLMVMGSITAEPELISRGYRVFPQKLSLDAYRYILNRGNAVGRAYFVTLFTTIVGTVISIVLTTSLAYPMSRRTFRYRNALSFFVYFTMLFNGGVVPSYIMWTNFFHIKNTFAALILPNLLMNAFNVFLVRNYYKNSIPESLYESAELDGASEFMLFIRITLPLSVPVISTVLLFTALSYWNSWTNAMYYVTDPKYFGIQNFLMRIMRNIEYLKNAADTTEDVAVTLPGQSIRMALAFVGLLPVAVTYPFVQKYFIKGVIVGAVKG